jgi:hypothetical protein
VGGGGLLFNRVAIHHQSLHEAYSVNTTFKEGAVGCGLLSVIHVAGSIFEYNSKHLSF